LAITYNDPHLYVGVDTD